MLTALTKKLAKGEYVKPEMEAEKSCFQVIHDLDHVSGKMHGSITSKKYIRNEIWSLINFIGVPYWSLSLYRLQILSIQYVFIMQILKKNLNQKFCHMTSEHV